MLPPWMLAAFYTVSGVAVVWLMFRMWQKRQIDRLDRTERPAPRPVRPAPTPTAEPVAMMAQPPVPPVPPVVPVIPEPVVPPAAPLSILKSSVPETPLVTAAAAAEQVKTNGTTHPYPSTWERTVFTRPEALHQALPRILPEDVPSVRTDDLSYGGLTPVLASMLPESEQRAADARKDLQAAGYYQPHASQNLAASRYLLMMLGLLLGGLALVLAPPQFEWIAVIGVVTLPLLGWAMPRLIVRNQADERKRQIEHGMPDLLDMLNMCVSQGLTIPESLKRILRDLRGPYPALAQELRIVSEQSQLAGLPTALTNFSKRIDLPEVHSFTTLLNQTERMGTSISEALTSYSDTMRESLRQRADEKGNQATFRLLFPTVFCLMPAVYLFLLGPAIVELSNFFYRGGRESLDQSSSAIERLNAIRQGGPVPYDRAVPQ